MNIILCTFWSIFTGPARGCRLVSVLRYDQWVWASQRIINWEPKTIKFHVKAEREKGSVTRQPVPSSPFQSCGRAVADLPGKDCHSQGGLKRTGCWTSCAERSAAAPPSVMWTSTGHGRERTELNAVQVFPLLLRIQCHWWQNWCLGLVITDTFPYLQNCFVLLWQPEGNTRIWMPLARADFNKLLIWVIYISHLQHKKCAHVVSQSSVIQVMVQRRRPKTPTFRHWQRKFEIPPQKT